MIFKSKNFGFTLVELLVVVSILSFLSSILLASLAQARMSARDARRLADLNEISKALDLYYDNHGNYPPVTTNNPDTNWDPMITALRADKLLGDLNGGRDSFWDIVSVAYAAGSPQDPNYPASTYQYMTEAGSISHGTSYRIRAKMENINSQSLKSSLTGSFQSGSFTTGTTACDPSLGYYCIGTSGPFFPFSPSS